MENESKKRKLEEEGEQEDSDEKSPKKAKTAHTEVPPKPEETEEGEDEEPEEPEDEGEYEPEENTSTNYIIKLKLKTANVFRTFTVPGLSSWHDALEIMLSEGFDFDLNHLYSVNLSNGKVLVSPDAEAQEKETILGDSAVQDLGFNKGEVLPMIYDPAGANWAFEVIVEDIVEGDGEDAVDMLKGKGTSRGNPPKQYPDDANDDDDEDYK